MTDQLFARFGRESPAGEVLFARATRATRCSSSRPATVRITKRVGQTQKILAVLGPGEFVGEMAILNGKPRTATATVVGAGQCLIISAKTLEAMVAKNTEIALRLIKKLAKRLDSADTLIEILMHQDPRVRVMLGALALRRDVRASRTGEGIADSHRAPRDLADEVGVERSVAEDVLDRLRGCGSLRAEPDGTLLIADVARLHDFLEFLRDAAEAAGERGRRAMDLRVIGCHGGETPQTSHQRVRARRRLAIDAGSLTSGLELHGAVQARGVPRQPRAPRSHPRPRDHRRQPLPERLRAARHRRPPRARSAS